MKGKKLMLKLINKILWILIISVLAVACSSTKSEDENFEDMLGKMRKQYDFKNDLSRIDTNEIMDRARDYVISGSVLQQQYRLPESILEFQKALKYDSSASIYYMIARSYQQMNSKEDATNNLIKSLDYDREFLPSLELLGEIFTSNFEIKKAIQTYERIIRIKDKRSYRYMLASLYEFEDVAKAIELYEELDPEGADLQVLKRMVQLSFDSGNFEKYLYLMKRIYELEPTNLGNAFELIEAYGKFKKFEDLREFLNVLSKTLPTADMEAYYSSYGNSIYSDSTNVSNQFIPEFVEKIETDYFLNWRLVLLAAYLSEKSGNNDKAEALFIRFVDIADITPENIMQLVYYYFRTLQYAKGVKAISNHETKFPNFFQFHFMKGIGLLNIDSSEQAIIPLKKALEIDDKNIDVISQIGLAYDRLGQADSSDRYYEKGLEIDPLDPLLNNNFAYSMSERGENLKKALEMAEIAVEKESDNPSYWDTYAWVLFKMEYYDEAYEKILLALELDSKNSEIYKHLGEILLKLGKKEEAIKAWTKGLEIDPQFEPIIKLLSEHK